MRKKYSFIINLVLGFISLWWFILSYSMAFNIDNKTDVEFLVPLGFILLILLIVMVIGINFFIYKRIGGIRNIILVQIIPCVMGIIYSFVMTTRK